MALSLSSNTPAESLLVGYVLVLTSLEHIVTKSWLLLLLRRQRWQHAAGVTALTPHPIFCRTNNNTVPTTVGKTPHEQHLGRRSLNYTYCKSTATALRRYQGNGFLSACPSHENPPKWSSYDRTWFSGPDKQEICILFLIHQTQTLITF
jgi:hypothetical protein